MSRAKDNQARPIRELSATELEVRIRSLSEMADRHLASIESERQRHDTRNARPRIVRHQRAVHNIELMIANAERALAARRKVIRAAPDPDPQHEGN